MNYSITPPPCLFQSPRRRSGRCTIDWLRGGGRNRMTDFYFETGLSTASSPYWRSGCPPNSTPRRRWAWRRRVINASPGKRLAWGICARFAAMRSLRARLMDMGRQR